MIRMKVFEGSDNQIGTIQVTTNGVKADLPNSDLEEQIEGLANLERYNAAEPPKETDTPSERKEDAPEEFLANHIAGILRTHGLATSQETV